LTQDESGADAQREAFEANLKFAEILSGLVPTQSENREYLNTFIEKTKLKLQEDDKEIEGEDDRNVGKYVENSKVYPFEIN